MDEWHRPAGANNGQRQEIGTKRGNVPEGSREFFEIISAFGPMMRVDMPDGRVEFCTIPDDYVVLEQHTLGRVNVARKKRRRGSGRRVFPAKYASDYINCDASSCSDCI